MKIGLVSTLLVTCGLAAGCLEPPPQPAQPSVTPPSASPTPSKPVVALTPAQAPPTATPAFGFSPTLDQVSGKQGQVEYKVKLPQVTGDKAAARDRFNEGMRTALDDTVRGLNDAKLTKPATIGDGQLQAQESSRVSFIGPHVLTGVAVFLTNSGGPYPSHRVATITINTDTAQPIMFGEVFADQGAARERLRALALELGAPDRIKAAGDMKSEQFLHWVPVPKGLTFYISVPHAAGDYVPVTVPWAKIRDQVVPAMVPVLSQ
ncbi:Protein of uncharacterised function (DUF3298) [Mycobacteroides abscessus subsp. bolletii]|nr:Protein of uncharacterised function (DUF3298) [Mycobacteroides abscessus subsp. bolletii]SKF64147.1 Protein of uncharacterised function (DUF3298) [Mycobacteroides abscessus subsp. bolletii]SKF93516.1 Protein of uncharacterised function (DUF3298) [Mycobacteroides abscessus subsp. bolletii]SKG08561.1 Protein of uncharacterised function (DUF3298) [Mycobacteroides abscessus subsp. bolletii]SKG24778.1 Protein of uncharacterised function (DUF3298) [Mycobacteroides abscessus subsp. bolletii]